MTHYNFGNVQKCFYKKKKEKRKSEKRKFTQKGASLFQRRLLSDHFFFGILHHETKLIMDVNLHRCFATH